MSDTVAFAKARAPDRLVAVGLLAIRALRYVAEGRPPELPPIVGLRLTASGAVEQPSWHATTGLYGFVALPPGACRVLITDPQRRFLPAAFNVMVPDRSSVRSSLQRGAAAPVMTPRPLIRDVALHVAPGRPSPPGITAVQGVVRQGQAGPPIALARLALTTAVDGALRTFITWSAVDGSYVLQLPGESPGAIGGAPPFRVDRALAVHVPRPPLAKALAADPLAAVPAEIDRIDPDAAGAVFERRGFALRSDDGTFRARVGNANPALEILGGQRRRWDIEIV